jgi:formylmethanofuran dehydrogenase subunit C
MITLKPKVEFRVPVEAECISPDVLAGKSAEDLSKLVLLWGNREKTLGDVFEIEVDGKKSDHVVIDGDVEVVKHIGARMTRGKLTINGNVGMHLGREMEGGEILVEGNAGDWAGAEMRGGLIHIKGSAGDLVGSAYRGSTIGMKDGAIIIDGNAGNELGELLKGGNIAVNGDIGSFAGALMSGGLIACFGNVGQRAGAGMTNGTILTLNAPRLLPTFKFTRVYNPKLLKPRLEGLKKGGFPIKKVHIEGLYDRYEGDIASDGKGRIIVWKSGPPKPKANP